MKRRFWKLALLIAVPLVLFAFVAERNRWRPKTIFSIPDGTVHWLHFSPDGRYLCLSYIGGNYRPRFYEIDSGRWIQLAAVNTAESAHFVGKSHFFYTNGLYSFPQGQRLASFPSNLSPLGELVDGRTLVFLRERGVEQWEVVTWDYLSGKPPRTLPSLPAALPKGAHRTFNLLADNRTLLILDQASIKDGSNWHLWFWDIAKKKLVFQAQAQSSEVESTASGLCSVLSKTGDLEVWNYQTGQRLHKFQTTPIRAGGGASSYTLSPHAVAPDGTLLAFCDVSYISLIDSQSGKVLRTLNGHSGVIMDVCFSPDGRTLASSSNDGTVKLWRIK